MSPTTTRDQPLAPPTQIVAPSISPTFTLEQILGYQPDPRTDVEWLISQALEGDIPFQVNDTTGMVHLFHWQPYDQAIDNE